MKLKGLPAARIAALAALIALGVTASPGNAALQNRYVSEFSGADSTAGPFGDPLHVGFHSGNGRAFVAGLGAPGDGNSVLSQFDGEGQATAFSDLTVGGNSITLPTIDGEDTQIAVDQSGTASDGNVYVLEKDVYFGNDWQAELYGFDETGAPLPGFPKHESLVKEDRAPWATPDIGWGSDYMPSHYCGMDVDKDGHIWIATKWGGAYEFDANAEPLSGRARNPHLTDVNDSSDFCDIAFNADSSRMYVNHIANAYKNKFSYWVPDGNGDYVESDNDRMDSGAVGSEDEQTKDLAIDRATGHVYVLRANEVRTYTANGALLTTFGSDKLTAATSLAIDSTGRRIYVSDTAADKVFVFTGMVPFPEPETRTPSNVEETSVTLRGVVDPDGEPVTACYFEWGPTTSYGNTAPCSSLPGDGTTPVPVSADITGLTAESTYHFRLVAENANGPEATPDDTFRSAGKPLIVSTEADDVGFSQATLRAQINPGGKATTFHVEYGMTSAYGSSTSESASIGSEASETAVARAISGLSSGTTYHYRFVATNSFGTTVGEDQTFMTHTPPGSESCANSEFRDGPSANLPDCRAYELVTPPSTNGQAPYYASACNAPGPNGTEAYLAGSDAYYFCVEGTTLEGTDGNGWANAYRAQRTSTDWTYTMAGPTGAQAKRPIMAAWDSQGNAFFNIEWRKNGQYFGSLPLVMTNGASVGTDFLRDAAGTFHLVGKGTRPVSPDDTDGLADGFATAPLTELIHLGEGARHLLFQLPTYSNLMIQLTPDAAPAGQRTLYDRTPDGVKAASVLPNGTVAPAWAEGTSLDGSIFAFAVEPGPDQRLYVRDLDKGVTDLVTPTHATSGGVTDDGRFFFYTSNGRLYRYEVATGGATAITPHGTSKFVNYTPDGSTVYFTSTSRFQTGQGTLGEPNLYVWDGGSIRFIATVSDSDLERPLGGNDFQGLTWDSWRTQRSQYLASTSRVTPDGSTLVFESNARLTSYDNEGHYQIYRFDQDEGLSCVSCPPTGDQSTAPARFGTSDYIKGNASGRVLRNLTEDGRTVFFESDQALLPGDLNAATDVYRWKDGHVALISSGTSDTPSYMTSISRDGRDVFFRTRATLVPNGQNAGVEAIYDARVGGGLPAQHEGPAAPCQGDECQAAGAAGGAAPPAVTIGSVDFATGGNEPTLRPMRVTVTRRSVRSTRFSLFVRTPGAGRISAVGAHVRQAGIAVRESGEHTLELTLSKAARKRLKRTGTLRVSIRVSFTPERGEVATRTVAFTVKATKQRPKKRSSRAGTKRRTGR